MIRNVSKILLALILCLGIFSELPCIAGRKKDPEATYHPMTRRFTLYVKCPTEDDRLIAVSRLFGFPLIYTKQDMPRATKRRQ
jgi:hypothetical protein